ncbi:MAG: hypothetical protein CMP74_02395 [Flavobacteriales bacterium]|nr:hypothetical protein [Flavobacteriales bacterium]
MNFRRVIYLGPLNNTNCWGKQAFNTNIRSATVAFGSLKRTSVEQLRVHGGAIGGSKMNDEARVLIRAGNVEIDLSGAQTSVHERLTRVKEDDSWSIALSRIRNARERAIEAAVEAARDAGLPERGSAFRALIENCSLIRKPDQVLGAIQYLRDVEGVNDSPPRVIDQLFEDAGLEPPGNLSLYLNRLRERGFLVTPPSAKEKNRYAILTPEGRAHLDKRSRY